MRLEIKSASSFLSSLLRLGNSLKIEQLELFRTQMEDLLRHHYQHHWFPDKPCKGSGYRCIRINHKMDPLISKAGSACGLDEASLRQLFPNELTLWIDPREVSYRIGENGSICVLFDGNKSQVSDIDDLQDYNGETPVSGPMYGQQQQQQLHHRQHPQPHHQHHQQQHPQQHHNQLNQVYHHQQHHHNQVDRYNRPSCKESMRNQNSWDCFIMDPRNMNFEHLAAYVSS